MRKTMTSAVATLSTAILGAAAGAHAQTWTMEIHTPKGTHAYAVAEVDSITFAMTGPPLDMILVPAGVFTMGDGASGCGTDEREVTLTRSFWLGRYEVTMLPEDRWRYRTPTLRNVALTAPYMHDGSIATLRDVLDFYNLGGVPNEVLDPLIMPLGLSDAEIEDLLAFLRSLTGSNVGTLVSDAHAAPIGGS